MEPSRFPEADAQPVRSLRVRCVHAARVWRCDVRSAERDYERELPANLASDTTFGFAPPGGDIFSAYDGRTSAAHVPKQFLLHID